MYLPGGGELGAARRTSSCARSACACALAIIASIPRACACASMYWSYSGRRSFETSVSCASVTRPKMISIFCLKAPSRFLKNLSG